MTSQLTPAQARAKHRGTFERFWAAYPKHTHPVETAEAWGLLMESGADPVRIISSATRYAASCGSELQYVPAPHRWLKNGRYDDADLFADETAGIKTWFQQQSRTANVKAVEDRLHISMPKTYPPDDITSPKAIRFWYEQQARAWIRAVYEERYETCQDSQPSTSEPSLQSSEPSSTTQDALQTSLI